MCENKNSDVETAEWHLTLSMKEKADVGFIVRETVHERRTSGDARKEQIGGGINMDTRASRALRNVTTV